VIKTDDEKAITIALLKGHGLHSTRSKEKAILSAIMNAALINTGLNHKGVPGEVIKALPKEIRDILSDCKSKDWQHRLEILKWLKS